MKHIKKGRRRGATLIAVALTTGVAVGGAYVSSGAAKQVKATAANSIPTIAFVCATASQQPFFQPIQKGAEAAAKAGGVKLSYTGLTQPNAFTAPIITSALQVAINQHPTALVACDFFPPSEDPLLKKAAKEGIPVFVTNSTSTASDKLAIANFSESNYLGGEKAAKLVASQGAKDGLAVDDNPGNPSVVQRCAGFAAGAKAAGMKVSILTLPQGDSSDATLEDTAVKGALAKNPKIDAVLMMGPVQGPAAALAVQQSGDAGKVKVGTFDLSSTVLTDISKGTMDFGIWQEPYLQGYLAVQAAADYVKYGFSPTGSVGTGPTFVTKKNVAAVKKAVAAFGG